MVRLKGSALFLLFSAIFCYFGVVSHTRKTNKKKKNSPQNHKVWGSRKSGALYFKSKKIFFWGGGRFFYISACVPEAFVLPTSLYFLGEFCLCLLDGEEEGGCVSV